MRTMAAVGGFLDSFGGGGWGPQVTSTLHGTTHKPKAIIGSSNCRASRWKVVKEMESFAYRHTQWNLECENFMEAIVKLDGSLRLVP